MKVLMFGWEFPPKSSGGLGTACYGLTKGLVDNGVEVTFVLPTSTKGIKSHVKLVSLNSSTKSFRAKFKKIESFITPYMTSKEYNSELKKEGLKKERAFSLYGTNLFEEVERYAFQAIKIAKEEEFDIIHCHDWLTFKAGINAKKISGKPLVVHVHATEFDRTANQGVNQAVYDIELEGMNAADKIISVSNFTKIKILENYPVDKDKIQVVHNAVDLPDNFLADNFLGNSGEENISGEALSQAKVVLFLGRLTIQKGPEYFLYAAKKVLEAEPDTKFVVAGSGDMESFMIEKAAELGISNNVLFAGFLNGKDVDRAYKMARVYVMPSVSEPFGITPLEAIRNQTPVVISKQSGVSEVLCNCFKVDFWDVNHMASQIVSLLKYKELHEEMRENSANEIRKFSWKTSAAKCIQAYKSLGVA